MVAECMARQYSIDRSRSRLQRLSLSPARDYDDDRAYRARLGGMVSMPMAPMRLMHQVSVLRGGVGQLTA